MQCAKFEQRLQQLLDDRQSVEQDAILHEHSRGCDDCGRILRAQSKLFLGLSSLPESRLPEDLGVRVLDQLRIDQRKRNNKRIMLVALAIAATIMIALLPLAGDHARVRQQGEKIGGGLALATPKSQQTSDRLTKQESDDLRMLMHQLVQRLSDQRFHMFEPVDQLASGIRPLAVTFNFALDTLRRTLPGYSQPQPIEPQAFYRSYRTLLS